MTANEGKKLGLSNAEAKRRLLKNGYNEIVSPHRFSGVVALLGRFKNPLVIILLLAAVLSGFLGDRTSAAIIIVIVLISTLLDFINTYKSDKAAEALKSRVRVQAAVYRGGQVIEIPVRNLVVGDVVQLKIGDIIPADGKVLDSEHFYVNESVLNGESFPKDKETGAEVYMGSSTISGSANVVITGTGRDTKYSHIAAQVSEREAPTEFDREIKDFSLLIIRLTFGLVLFVFLTSALLKHDLLESLLFSVALAVGLTPELLPMIITLNLTKGSLAMAKRGVIVKKLSAIENFGSMDILCTDKTGTLTEDRIEVIKYVDCFGGISERVLLHAYIASEFEAGFKSPLDAAIKEFRRLDIGAYHRVSEIPFDFERKRSSVIVRRPGGRQLITRGAPEEVLKVCTSFDDDQPLTDSAKQKALAEFQALSEDGFRVLAVAVKQLESHKRYTSDDESGMTMLGFIAFLDPAKKTVAATLRHMREHGIEIKVLTGDNDLVTQKIAHDIHLNVKGTLTGVDIEAMNDDELAKVVENTTIFARLNPAQKVRIIHQLQRAGHVVGYMGDGINDAPSLKAADTGVSVNNAVDIAKDTADLILMHKSLADLIAGVIVGRKTFANTLKYLKMALSSNFGNMFSMAGAALFLPFLPMLAPQILFNNLLYDTAQITLPLDNVDPEEIKRPRTLKIGFLKRFMLVFGPLSSVFDFLTFFVLYGALHLSVGQFQAGWFIESIATQLLVIYVLRTKKLPFIQSRPSVFVLFTTVVAIIIAAVAIFSGIAHYFQFVAPPAMAMIAIACIVAAYLLAVQLIKSRFYRWSDL